MTRFKNVRNTTKFKRSINAISPVIATLLMIAIAVVASLVVYAWVTGYMGNTTSKAGKAIAIPSFAVDDSGNMVIYVQNVGQGDVEVSSVYINGDLRFSTNTPIGEGETEELSVTTGAPYDPTERYDIKVTTTDGTFMTATGKPGTGGAPNPSTSVPPGTLVAGVDPAGPVTMTTSQTQTFTASSSGGTGSKLYQWYLDASTVSGEVASTYTYTASSGNHDVYVKVTDSAVPPVSDDSSTVSITVTDALVASITPSGSLTMDAGQQRTFTASATGGTGPYSYAWYIDGSAITGQTASTYSYPAAVGSDSIYCKVTDSASTPATDDSDPVSITISAAMTVSISPTGPLTMTSGQAQAFTSTVTGGTGTKSYQWYLEGSAVSGQTSATYTYTGATGSHNIYLRVTDSASTPSTVQSATTSITVNAAPATVTRSPSANSGSWSNEDNAYADGGSNQATSNDDGEQTTWSGYGFTVPTGATVTQVRVRLDAWNSYNDDVRLEVYDGSWRTYSPNPIQLSTSSNSIIWCDVTSLSPSGWTVSEVNNIQVRLTHDAENTEEDIFLDWVPVEVTYTT